MPLVLHDASPAITEDIAITHTATVKVLLIRHGESQSNAGLATKCSELIDLTKRGRAQAKKIANYLFHKSLIPDLIVTSRAFPNSKK
jgi:bisphosphoglycerate-dependent phosphoglycerate mutase